MTSLYIVTQREMRCLHKPAPLEAYINTAHDLCGRLYITSTRTLFNWHRKRARARLLCDCDLESAATRHTPPAGTHIHALFYSTHRRRRTHAAEYRLTLRCAGCCGLYVLTCIRRQREQARANAARDDVYRLTYIWRAAAAAAI